MLDVNERTNGKDWEGRNALVASSPTCGTTDDRCNEDIKKELGKNT
jgi:hypothetical protein